MVRYELILHRYPKLSVADIPKRMGDLPEEFSEGTLQRALENPEGGAVAIAWGDRRKRLLQVKRRIEILGGSAELVDRAGPMAKRLTSIADDLRGLLPTKAEDDDKTRLRDPTELNFIWIGLAAAATAGALIYAQGAEDQSQRTRAVQGAGFALSLIMSQLFVRGVRRWYAEEGRAWVAALLMLIPMLSLGAAGYEAYALGVVKRSAAMLSGEGKTHAAKPLMKPFAALIVELRHRKERAELAAALASEGTRKPGDEPAEATDQAEGQAVAEAAEATAEAPEAANDQPSKSGRTRREAHDVGRKTAMTSSEANPTSQPTAATTPNDTTLAEATAMARWVGDTGQATPTTQVIAAGPSEPAVAPAPAPLPKQAAAPAPAPLEVSEPWDPLRRVDDVNEIHAAVAVALAVLMFMIGLWTGRRARNRRAVAIASADEPILEQELEQPPLQEQELELEAPESEPQEEEQPAFSAEQASEPDEEPTAQLSAPDDPWAEQSFEELAEDPPPTVPRVATDPLALPGEFSGGMPVAAEPSRRAPERVPSIPPTGLAEARSAPLEPENEWPDWMAEPAPPPPQPAAANDNDARTAGTKEKPRKVAQRGGTRGGIQEEVVRRRPDARRDD